MGIIKGKDVVNKSVEIDKLSQELQDAINNIPDTSNCVIRESEEDQHIIQSGASLFKVECKSEDESEESFVSVGVDQVSISSSTGFFSADVDAIDLIAERGDIQFFTRSDEGVMKYNDVEIATIDNIPDTSNFIVNGSNAADIQLTAPNIDFSIGDSSVTLDSNNAKIVANNIVLNSADLNIVAEAATNLMSANDITIRSLDDIILDTTNGGTATYNGSKIATVDDITAAKQLTDDEVRAVNTVVNNYDGFYCDVTKNPSTATTQDFAFSIAGADPDVDSKVIKIDAVTETTAGLVPSAWYKALNDVVLFNGYYLVNGANEGSINMTAFDGFSLDGGPTSLNFRGYGMTYNETQIATVDDIPDTSNLVINGLADRNVAVSTTGGYDIKLSASGNLDLGTSGSSSHVTVTTGSEGTFTVNGSKVATVDQIPNIENVVMKGTSPGNSGDLTISTDGKAMLSAPGGITLSSDGGVEFSVPPGKTVKYNTKEVAIIDDIPTAVSQLNNDAGYITSADLPDTSGFVPVATYNALLSRVEALEAKLAGVNGFWVGTEAEYDAVATKDPGTYYHIYEE